MKEKIQNILKTIKEKLKIKDEQLKKPKEILDKIVSKFPKKKKSPPSKLAFKIKRIFFKFVNLKTITMFIGFAVSLPAIAFLNYTIVQFLHFKKLEEVSKDSIIKAQLGYATRNLIKELSENKVKKRDLRQFIKELNEEDEFGNFEKHSSCDRSYKAYGESPFPGNVVITKENNYEFKLMAYNCEVEPIACDTIKLKKPEKTKENNQTSHKKQETKHNENKKVTAPKEEHPKPKAHTEEHKTTDTSPKEEHSKPETDTEEHKTTDTDQKEEHPKPETHKPTGNHH